MQILEIKTESPDTINALNTLSGVYTDNTPAARRQLRSTIEQRGLQINEQFLQAAEAVTKVMLRCAVLQQSSSVIIENWADGCVLHACKLSAIAPA